MSNDKVRVCVIGAGPSGLSVLYQFNQLKAQGEQLPEIVCFEKQSDWGGLWKFSNETGKTGRKHFCWLVCSLKQQLQLNEVLV